MDTHMTDFVEGFRANLMKLMLDQRGDSGVNLVRLFCEKVDILVGLNDAKDLSELEHRRIHEIGERVKQKAIADGVVKAPELGV
jgi:hypothetical protein